MYQVVKPLVDKQNLWSHFHATLSILKIIFFHRMIIEERNLDQICTIIFVIFKRWIQNSYAFVAPTQIQY